MGFTIRLRTVRDTMSILHDGKQWLKRSRAAKVQMGSFNGRPLRIGRHQIVIRHRRCRAGADVVPSNIWSECGISLQSWTRCIAGLGAVSIVMIIPRRMFRCEHCNAWVIPRTPALSVRLNHTRLLQLAYDALWADTIVQPMHILLD